MSTQVTGIFLKTDGSIQAISLNVDNAIKQLQESGQRINVIFLTPKEEHFVINDTGIFGVFEANPWSAFIKGKPLFPSEVYFGDILLLKERINE